MNAANKQIQSQKIKQKALGEIENRNNLQKFQKYLTDRETRDQMSYQNQINRHKKHLNLGQVGSKTIQMQTSCETDKMKIQ